jgi:hypothetical protein
MQACRSEPSTGAVSFLLSLEKGQALPVFIIIGQSLSGCAGIVKLIFMVFNYPAFSCIRYTVIFILAMFLMTVSLSSDIALGDAGAPVIYNYQDPATGTTINYVGIPGGPVVYSKLGPSGVQSVTSVNAGNPVIYSNVGPGGITSVSSVSPGGPVVYSNLGPGSVKGVSFVNPGIPAVMSIQTRVPETS